MCSKYMHIFIQSHSAYCVGCLGTSEKVLLQNSSKTEYIEHVKRQLYVFGVEGINKESRQCHVYPLRLREELFCCILVVRSC